jgi:superfamily II DNA or RNA helicase
MRAFLAPRGTRPGTRVGATYVLPASALSAEDAEDVKAQLTLQAKAGFGAPPPPYVAWKAVGDELHVPRFYGLERFGPAETDERVDGEALGEHVRFAGTLTPVQEKVTAAMFSKPLAAEGVHGGIVSLYCGGGKTAWTCYAIARLGRKACVLVHKAVLRDQWKESLERFCPGVRVGFVQGNRFEVEGYDVVLAMVLTLAKRDYDPSVMDAFGTVVCDEAHHMAAPVMNQAMRLFRARYVLGLSATVSRPDGLTPLLHWSLGPLGVHLERDCEPVRVSVALYHHAAPREMLTRDGKPLVALMVNWLAKHPGRNEFLAERILAYRRAHRVIIVLSDRIEQLKVLRARLGVGGLGEDEVGLFVGATKEAQRAVELAKPVVLCSYAMANEGLDKKELDTCVMATPKGRVTQCIGRVQRPCATKQPPLVLDVADTYSVFVPLRWKRQGYYRKEGYKVQVVDVGSARDEEEEWFM